MEARVAPNPSNEVDVYNPGTNSWSTAPSFTNARRNFPTDTNGTDHIWLSGGYDVDGVTPLSSMEIFDCPQASPTPTPTATATATATATPTATAQRQLHQLRQQQRPGLVQLQESIHTAAAPSGASAVSLGAIRSFFGNSRSIREFPKSRELFIFRARQAKDKGGTRYPSALDRQSRNRFTLQPITDHETPFISKSGSAEPVLGEASIAE